MADDGDNRERRNGKVTLAEKALALLALLVLIGWIIRFGNKEHVSGLATWFPMLSASAALVLAVVITLRFFDRLPIPDRFYRWVISGGCVLPLVGFLVAQLDSVGTTFTVWGSIAIAYIAATTFWRRHIPEFALDPLREGTRDEKPRHETPPAAAPTPAESPGGDERPAGSDVTPPGPTPQ